MMQSAKEVSEFTEKYSQFQVRENENSKEFSASIFEGSFLETLTDKTGEKLKVNEKKDQKYMKGEECGGMWKTGCDIEEEKEASQTENTNATTEKVAKAKIIKGKKSVQAKRPIAYETEKSFYMKQKIIGSRRGDKRILRERKIKKSKKIHKKEEKGSKVKSQKDIKKKQEKEKIKDKETIKTCKKLLKPLQKLVFDLYSFSAEVPNLITGTADLNEFSRSKLERLKLRMIKK